MRKELNWRKDMREPLKLVAPGTILRESLENILRAKTGGLLVIGDSPAVRSLVEGGFLIDDTISATRLYELAKMDGAIILDEKAETIWKANTQLQPTSDIESEETGIRHRVAARVARQTGAVAIAISQRRSMITIFKGSHKFVLSDLGVLLAKSNQALQTLERYCIQLRKELENLSLLEYDNAVVVNDVAIVVQRSEMVKRITEELEFLLLQMGSEGRLIRMQMEELTNDVEGERRDLIFDYCAEPTRKAAGEAERLLRELDDEDLLERQFIARAMGFGGGDDGMEQPLQPRGYRVLGRIPRLTSRVVDNIVKYFGGNLQNIIEASLEELDEVDGVGAVRSNAIKRGLERLRERADDNRFYS